jgi:hypothetical protein
MRAGLDVFFEAGLNLRGRSIPAEHARGEVCSSNAGSPGTLGFAMLRFSRPPFVAT